MKAVTRVLLILSAVVFLVGCAGLLYYPSRRLYVDVNKLDPKPIEVTETMPDGLVVHGWLFLGRESRKPIILFFHGNGQNRSIQFLSLYWLVQEGYELLIYDYPGYGTTLGKPSPRKTVLEASELLRLTSKKYGGRPLVVYGQSLGGAIAARAVWETRNEVHPKLLVLDSTFTSYQTAARKIMSKSAWTWAFQPLVWVLFSDRWAPGKRLKEIKDLPTIVIHSRKDEIISFDQGEKVFKNASEPKEFWTRETGAHNSTFSGDDGKDLREKLLSRLKAL